MDLPEKHLIVKRSAIPGADRGLFTKVPIPKGTRIIENKGRVTTWKDVRDRDGRNTYLFYVDRNHVIDSQHYLRALARYANDARGLARVPGLANNCAYVVEGKRVFIEAIKDIPAGAELLVGYGREYWDAIRYNKKIKEKK